MTFQLTQRRTELEILAVWLFSRLLILFAVSRLASDLPLYQSFALQMSEGQVPYLDFALDHPPLVLPFFLLPRLTEALLGYELSFRLMMLVIDGLCFGLMSHLIRRMMPERMAGVLGLYIWLTAAAFPMIYDTIDLIPALTVLLLVYTGMRKRFGWGCLLLGAAFFLNAMTVFLWPLWFVIDLKYSASKSKTIIRFVCLTAITALLVIAGHLALGQGFLNFLTYHWFNGVQIESFSASVLSILHYTGLPPDVDGSTGVFKLVGPAVQAVSMAVLIAGAAALILLVRLACRRTRPEPPDENSTGRLCLCILLPLSGLLLSLLTGQFLLPQYFIWLYPLAALGLLCVPSRAAWTVLWLALAVYTTSIYPYNYLSLINQKFWGNSLLLMRSAALVFLLIWTVRIWTVNHTNKLREG